MSRSTPSVERTKEGMFLPPGRGRLWIGLVIAVLGPVLITPIARLDPLSTFPGVPYVLVVVAATIFGRLLAAGVATLVSVILLERYFVDPAGGFGLPGGGDVWAIAIFILVALAVAEILVRLDRSARAETRERDRLAFLARAGDALSGPLSVDAALAQLGQVLVPTLADWFSVDLLEDGEIRNVVVVHPDPTRVEVARELQQRFPTDADSPTGPAHVIRTGVSELTETITEPMLEGLIVDPAIRETVRALGLRCAMVVPLTARGRNLGALTLIGAESHERYGPDDLRLAEEIADRAALAIDTARLFAAQREARAAATADARRSSVLKDVTAAFGRAETVDEVMASMLEQGIRLAGAAAGTVGLTSNGGRVDLVAISGYEPDDHPFWHSFGLDDRLPMSDAINESRPVVLSTTAERDERYPALIGRGEQRDHALVCLPLMLGPAVIGGFSASYPPDTEFGDEDLSFLRALGEQCAQAIDRARSVERERETRARFDALAKASRELASTLDYEATARTVVRLAVEHLGGRATLLVREHETLSVLAEADEAGDRVAAESTPGFEPEIVVAIADAVEQGRPQVLDGSSATADERADRIVLPLSIADSKFGALLVVGSRRDFAREDEVAFAREIARRIARAMENARLYRERDYVARTLQRSLLPPELPEIPGVEVEALFLPALQGYEVGGDFYDVFEQRPGRWVAVIGDVCGKGVEAATLTGMSRHTLRALADVTCPSEALGQLNRALLREQLDGRFCTVVYATIEPLPDGGGAIVSVASGGHPLPQLVTADGSTRSVGRHGTLLGVTERPHLEDVQIRLEPGQSLVLFTDGILRRTEAFGNEPGGVSSALRGHTSGSAAELRDRIEAYVRDLVADGQDDDIAVLVLRAR